MNLKARHFGGEALQHLCNLYDIILLSHIVNSNEVIAKTQKMLEDRMKLQHA